jgi:hypothetical protein
MLKTADRRGYEFGALGGMLALSEKTFSGSYRSFSATSLRNFSSP